MWGLFKKKVPTFVDAYKRMERLLKDLELINAILQDTEDWKKLGELQRRKHADTLQDFYIKGHFALSSFRDEQILMLRQLPQLRLVRRRHGPAV